MERVDEGTFRCTVCGTKVQVGANETPVAMLVGQSGKLNERVVKVGNVEVHREVHRCVVPDVPRTVRWV